MPGGCNNEGSFSTVLVVRYVKNENWFKDNACTHMNNGLWAVKYHYD